jgi:hypothetical protein
MPPHPALFMTAMKIDVVTAWRTSLDSPKKVTFSTSEASYASLTGSKAPGPSCAPSPTIINLRDQRPRPTNAHERISQIDQTLPLTRRCLRTQWVGTVSLRSPSGDIGETSIPFGKNLTPLLSLSKAASESRDATSITSMHALRFSSTPDRGQSSPRLASTPPACACRITFAPANLPATLSARARRRARVETGARFR